MSLSLFERSNLDWDFFFMEFEAPFLSLWMELVWDHAGKAQSDCLRISLAADTGEGMRSVCRKVRWCGSCYLWEVCGGVLQQVLGKWPPLTGVGLRPLRDRTTEGNSKWVPRKGSPAKLGLDSEDLGWEGCRLAVTSALQFACLAWWLTGYAAGNSRSARSRSEVRSVGACSALLELAALVLSLKGPELVDVLQGKTALHDSAFSVMV